jgi:hypothetical protein
MIRVWRFTVLAALSLVGCGSSPGGAGPSDAMFANCAVETRAQPYQSGMQVMSSNGLFTVRLLESNPGPPVKGQNTWTVEVDDVASGAPLDGLDVAVLPWMPDHVHGSTPVAVTPDTAGKYTLKPVYLYMSGYWEVRFTIVGNLAGQTTSDAAMIPMCIP